MKALIVVKKKGIALNSKIYHELNYFSCKPIKCILSEKKIVNFFKNLINIFEGQNNLFETNT